jgi:hypothetical protein
MRTVASAAGAAQVDRQVGGNSASCGIACAPFQSGAAAKCRASPRDTLTSCPRAAALPTSGRTPCSCETRGKAENDAEDGKKRGAERHRDADDVGLDPDHEGGPGTGAEDIEKQRAEDRAPREVEENADPVLGVVANHDDIIPSPPNPPPDSAMPSSLSPPASPPPLAAQQGARPPSPRRSSRWTRRAPPALCEQSAGGPSVANYAQHIAAKARTDSIFAARSCRRDALREGHVPLAAWMGLRSRRTCSRRSPRARACPRGDGLGARRRAWQLGPELPPVHHRGVQRGYVILAPEYRGSTGYGEAVPQRDRLRRQGAR